MSDRKHTQKRPVARGVRKNPGCLQCVVELDDDTFETVRQRAIKQSTSFGEQVRILIEWGLEAETAHG